MLFESGFLGTRALLFMDMVTIYFAILPFLVFSAIQFVIKGNYKAHYLSQFIIFLVTLIMVVVFEIGVRTQGGFAEFAQETTISYIFLSTFLIVHILIALVTILGWVILIYNSSRSYYQSGKKAPYFVRHKAITGRLVFLGICITSLTGCLIYGFLFIF